MLLGFCVLLRLSASDGRAECEDRPERESLLAVKVRLNGQVVMVSEGSGLPEHKMRPGVLFQRPRVMFMSKALADD